MSWLQTTYCQFRDHPYQTLLPLFGCCVAVYLVTIPLHAKHGAGQRARWGDCASARWRSLAIVVPSPQELRSEQNI